MLSGVSVAPGVTRPVARGFDAEIEAALRSAKAAAGFEFLGTLSRVCLLPASGGLNTSNTVPRYISDPETVPSREAWYADPAQVFDNLFFVGGIIIIDTIYPYNSEALIMGGLERLGLTLEISAT